MGKWRLMGYAGRGLLSSSRPVVPVLVAAGAGYLLVTAAGAGPDLDGAARLVGAATILCGCVVFSLARERAIAARAHASERRRVARDLHDGLAQELAFIVVLSQQLDTANCTGTVDHLKRAAEHALAESRSLISDLTTAEVAPLDGLLADTARRFGSRFGVKVDVEVERDVVVDREQSVALLRILDEALANAARHGGAQRVGIRLSRSAGSSLLSIADDGKGFDPADASAGEGFGLTSMRERAELAGGTLDIATGRGVGTRVEVRLP